MVQAFLDIADVPADANATLNSLLDAKEERDHAEHGISGSFRFQDRRGQGVTTGSLRRRGGRGRVGAGRYPRRGDEDCEQSSCETSPVRHLKIKMALIAAFTLDRVRPAMRAIALTTDSSALTAIANDFGVERMFARQVEAIGRAGDVLLAISTSGNSPNVLAAAESAHAQAMRVVALTGASGGGLAPLSDVAVRVPSTVTAHIQECHLAIEQLLASLAERAIHPGAG